MRPVTASASPAARPLTDAAIRGAKDNLLGPKENIIIGHLIPAGTGMYRYQEVDMDIAAPPMPELPQGEEAFGGGLLGTPMAAEIPSPLLRCRVRRFNGELTGVLLISN